MTTVDVPPEPVDDREDRDTAPHPADALRGVLGRYDRPNRRTVCPRAPTPGQRTTAWITVDVAAVYDLAEARCAPQPTRQGAPGP